MGQGRLAEARGPVKQHVVERFAALHGGLDEDGQIVLDPALPDEFIEHARAQGLFEVLFAVDGLPIDDAVALHLWTPLRFPRRGEPDVGLTDQPEPTRRRSADRSTVSSVAGASTSATAAAMARWAVSRA